MTEKEYDDLQEKRKNDDFIVNDGDLGYNDRGGEVFEVDYDEVDRGGKNKKKKFDVIHLS